MDCKHAYFLDGVQYVLCDCEGQPKKKKLDEITKHMCGYQRFCPNIRACALLPEWVNCSKLRKGEPPAEPATPAVTKKTTSERAKKKKA